MGIESRFCRSLLIDAHLYAADDIRDLFRKRWLVEQDIRALNSNLGIDVLRCQTPEMVRQEIGVARLAYHLIRQTMLQAVPQADFSPRELSFTHAMQTLASSWPLLPVLSPAAQARQIAAALKGLCQQRVGRRPDRVEPHAMKRRPKPHEYLTKSRAEARAELLLPKV